MLGVKRIHRERCEAPSFTSALIHFGAIVKTEEWRMMRAAHAGDASFFRIYKYLKLALVGIRLDGSKRTFYFLSLDDSVCEGNRASHIQ